MTVRRRASHPVVAIVALALAAAGFSAPAFASDADSGTPVTVNITDGSTPAPPSSSSPSTAGSGGSSGGSSWDGTGSTVVGAGGTGSSSGSVTSPAGQSTPANEVSVGGGLYVGGLNGSGMPSIDPGDGSVEMWFTVRNSSSSPVDATADFWMDGAIFSNRLGAVDGVPIAALQPGETRVVTASVHGVGQWTLVSAHVTFTPPATVDGAAATAVTRDALVLVFPWLLVLGAVVVVLAFVIVRVVRAALPPVPVAALS